MFAAFGAVLKLSRPERKPGRKREHKPERKERRGSRAWAGRSA